MARRFLVNTTATSSACIWCTCVPGGTRRKRDMTYRTNNGVSDETASGKIVLAVELDPANGRLL
jgi:hypothetical protein